MAGINFTVGVDGSQYFSGMKNMEATGKSTAKAIQDAFGAKLKSVLSLTAIEEGVRRTGEWAAEIDRASKSLGVTREQLQTIQLIASKTGTSQDAIVGMFDNINKARDEALKGNHELIQSFQRVGVTYDDLLNKTKQGLFSEVLGKANPNSKNEMMRTSIHNITGTPEGVLRGFQAGMGGQSFEAIQAVGLKSGAVIKEEEVQGIAAQWAQVITSLKDAGAQLIPIAGVLLDITKLLADGLGGIAEFIKLSFDAVIKFLQGDWSGVGKAFDGIGKLMFSFTFGVAKAIAMLIDLVWNFIRKIPGLSKLMPEIATAAELREQEKDYNSDFNISKETARRGGAAGEIAGMVGSTGAISAVSKVAGKAIGNVTGRVSGLAAEEAILKEAGLTRVSSKEATGIKHTPEGDRIGIKPGYIVAEGRHYKMSYAMIAERNARSRKMMEGGATMNRVDLMKLVEETTQKTMEFHKGISKSLRAADVASESGNIFGAKVGSRIGAVGVGGDIAGVFGRLYAAAQEERKNAMRGSTAAGEARPILPMWGAAGMGGAPATGGGMLKLGGMFGSGDNKIVKLNIEMVKLLNMIQVNTSPYAKAGGGYVVPQTNNMGGASGGL